MSKILNSCNYQSLRKIINFAKKTIINSLSPPQNALGFHEKLTAALFIGLILSLIKFAWHVPAERWPQNKLIERAANEQIVIWIYGEVESAGRYHFFKEITLRDALEEVKLTDQASLDGLKLDLYLKTGQRIKIKRRKSLVIN